jgi:hypothetical protein
MEGLNMDSATIYASGDSNLSEGAVLMDGDQIWHGSEAISVLCSQLKPSDPLLVLLNGLFRDSKTS